MCTVVILKAWTIAVICMWYEFQSRNFLHFTRKSKRQQLDSCPLTSLYVKDGDRGEENMMLLKLDSYFTSYHFSFQWRDSVKLIFHSNHTVSGALPRHLSCISNYSSSFYQNHWNTFPDAKHRHECVCVCLAWECFSVSVRLSSVLIRFGDMLLLLLNNN